jgi:peptide/nickel transport system permease protein
MTALGMETTAATAAGSTHGKPANARPWRRAVRRLARRRGAMAGAAVVLFFVAIAVAAPLIAPYDPVATSWSAVRKPPSLEHWFGTDEIGRDVLSRVMFGARASLLAGVVSVCISLACGVPVGLVSGYVGGFLDGLLMRITDALLACPFLILAIALAAFLGPSLTNAMIAIGISAMPAFIRLTRAQVLNAKVEDYVEAARAVGNPHRRIVLRHILPNILAPIMVQATLAIAAAIIAEASLSFLGLGQQPPSPSWGSMLNAAKNFLDDAPWMAMWPGAAIFSVVLAFNLFGDGLRDALDPRHGG